MAQFCHLRLFYFRHFLSADTTYDKNGNELKLKKVGAASPCVNAMPVKIPKIYYDNAPY